jgi:hypothetical protein
MNLDMSILSEAVKCLEQLENKEWITNLPKQLYQPSQYQDTPNLV